MRKLGIGFLFFQVIVSNCAFIAQFGDVQFNLKDDQTVIVPQSTFIQLRKYSERINNLAAKIEATKSAVTDLSFLEIDRESFKFIVDALRTLNSPGELIIKLKSYLRTEGSAKFATLMSSIEFFGIRQLINAYESFPQFQQACPIVSKRKKSESEKDEPKKLKIEAKIFRIEIPMDEVYRRKVIKIFNASKTLKNSISDMFNIDNLEDLEPKKEIFLPGISESQWYLIYKLADEIEDFSNDTQVHNALKQYSSDTLKNILLIADYLEMDRLLDNAIDLFLARLETVESVVDALSHLGAYENLFNQITPGVREILKRRILKSGLLREFHWSGPWAIRTDRDLSGIAMRPDGLIIAAGVNEAYQQKKGIILADTANKKISYLASLEFAPDAMKFNPNGNYLSPSARIGFSQSLFIIDIKNKTLDTIQNSFASASAFSHNNKQLAYIANGRFFTLFDLDTHKYDSVFDTWEVSHSTINSMAFSQNDQTIALGLADGRIFFLDLQSKKIIRRLLTEDMKPIESIIFINDKSILAKSYDGKIRVWDFEKDKVIEEMSFEYNDDPAWPTNPILSSNGEKIAADFFKEIRIWKVSEPQHYQTIILPNENWSVLRGQTNRVNFLSFNGDGSRIAMATRNGILVWKNIDDQLDKLSIDQVFALVLIKKYQIIIPLSVKAKIVLSKDFEKRINTLPMDVKILVEQYYPKFLSDLKLNK